MMSIAPVFVKDVSLAAEFCGNLVPFSWEGCDGKLLALQKRPRGLSDGHTQARYAGRPARRYLQIQA